MRQEIGRDGHRVAGAVEGIGVINRAILAGMILKMTTATSLGM